MTTRHVVLVTYGEPPTPAFASQLAYSWRILRGLTRTVAPIPAPLVPLIALARGWTRHRGWRAARYRSPLEPITTRQAARLADALSGDRDRWAVHVAYEFRAPLLADVLAALPPGEPAWIAPLYAAESAFTHALSRATARRVVAAARRPAPVTVLDPFDAGHLADLSAAHVLAHTPPEWRGPEVALVLAAHGTVLEPPTPIDTGLAATQALCDTLAARLAPHFGAVVNGWLNHTRGGRWTEPPIEAALQGVADRGCTRVVYYPYGFLADNAETELEGRLALAAQPRLAARHLPCLNDAPALITALARRIRAAAGVPVASGHAAGSARERPLAAAGGARATRHGM